MERSSQPQAGLIKRGSRARGETPAYSKGLRTLSISTVIAMAVSLSLVFFYAPLEAEQGFLQKIFYLHVPLAIVALCGFVLGGLLAIAHLRTRDPRWDYRSYVVIHMSLIFAVGTLITGSIWAKGSWGHWWVWSEPTLVSFLIVFLLYATYQPLRFAIEDPERQAR
ncbi:MAG TPA: cytochrome c biogenesis protein, partial [Solirubrobacteraceae bacterium]|nr:cytochrome c biogenesis protein [Solirubrobacteraceae bacterium]